MLDVSQRLQMKSTVQWLNQVFVLFTLALQQCQQLVDKVNNSATVVVQVSYRENFKEKAKSKTEQEDSIILLSFVAKLWKLPL